MPADTANPSHVVINPTTAPDELMITGTQLEEDEEDEVLMVEAVEVDQLIEVDEENAVVVVHTEVVAAEATIIILLITIIINNPITTIITMANLTTRKERPTRTDNVK